MKSTVIKLYFCFKNIVRCLFNKHPNHHPYHFKGRYLGKFLRFFFKKLYVHRLFVYILSVHHEYARRSYLIIFETEITVVSCHVGSGNQT